jgi:hypothetical protein
MTFIKTEYEKKIGKKLFKSAAKVQTIKPSNFYCDVCCERLGLAEKGLLTKENGKKIHWMHIAKVMKSSGLVNGFSTDKDVGELIELSITYFKDAALIPFEQGESLMAGATRIHEMLTGQPIDFAVLR